MCVTLIDELWRGDANRVLGWNTIWMWARGNRRPNKVSESTKDAKLISNDRTHQLSFDKQTSRIVHSRKTRPHAVSNQIIVVFQLKLYISMHVSMRGAWRVQTWRQQARIRMITLYRFQKILVSMNFSSSTTKKKQATLF